MLSGKIFRYLFITGAIIIAIASVWITDNLTAKLKEEERNMIDQFKAEERWKIELWAATIGVISSQTIANEEFMSNINRNGYSNVKQYIDNAFVNYDTLLTSRIVWGNTTIPVIMTDETGEIITVRNVLPEEDKFLSAEQDSANIEQEIYDISALIDNNRDLLKSKIKEFAEKYPPIEIKIADDIVQRVYYDDSTVLQQLLNSTVLKKLQIFPYVQLCVVFVFIIIAFVALNSTKKAEQNRVWVGLSKETAHQLGTPISSLIAWIEYLKTKAIDPAILSEIDKDVQRLKTVAERFSKIGSSAAPEPMDLHNGVQNAVDYLSRRISPKVSIKIHFPQERIIVPVNESLFGWVIENLVKNAVDAMNGYGDIHISAVTKKNKAILSISDTGKGIPKSKFDAVFRPGYTTKERGWGLGLSLVKRIIESYHKGKIYVYKSELGKGTTFRIELKTV